MTKNNQLETIINANVVNSSMGIGSFFKKVGIGALALVGLYGGSASAETSSDWQMGKSHSANELQLQSFKEARRAETIEYWLESARRGFSDVTSEYSHYVKDNRISNKDTLLVARVLAKEGVPLDCYSSILLSFSPEERSAYLTFVDPKNRTTPLVSTITQYKDDLKRLEPKLDEGKLDLLALSLYAYKQQMNELNLRLLLSQTRTDFSSSKTFAGFVRYLNTTHKVESLKTLAGLPDTDLRDRYNKGKFLDEPLSVASAKIEE